MSSWNFSVLICFYLFILALFDLYNDKWFIFHKNVFLSVQFCCYQRWLVPYQQPPFLHRARRPYSTDPPAQQRAATTGRFHGNHHSWPPAARWPWHCNYQPELCPHAAPTSRGAAAEGSPTVTATGLHPERHRWTKPGLPAWPGQPGGHWQVLLLANW